jgi:prefoldin subunit 5
VFLFFTLDAQSLVDIAREEAARRKHLEQQGIQGKVIVGNGLNAPSESGNVTTSTGTGMEIEKPSSREAGKRLNSSIQRFQSDIKKLDSEIRQTEGRIESLQKRLQTEKWEALKAGRSSGRSRSGNTKSQIQISVEKLQEKLKELRNKRFEVYESGKKAGHLPGELDGKFIDP